MVVIHVTRRGAYILAELDGSVWQNHVAAFRVILYLARKHIKLPDKIHKLIDVSEKGLKIIEDTPLGFVDLPQDLEDEDRQENRLSEKPEL